MQDNKKITEALIEWVEPIEGWFWDDDKGDSFKGRLDSYGCHSGDAVCYYLPLGRGEWYHNFSLTDPSKKRCISSVDDAVKWSTKNKGALVRAFGEDISNAFSLSSKHFYNTEVLTALNPDGSPVWTPLTEIEVTE